MKTRQSLAEREQCLSGIHGRSTRVEGERERVSEAHKKDDDDDDDAAAAAADYVTRTHA